MKKAFGIFAISILCISCNINPNKEERIQKLETEIQNSTEKINELEKRIESLESLNGQLNLRIQEIDNQ